MFSNRLTRVAPKSLGSRAAPAAPLLQPNFGPRVALGTKFSEIPPAKENSSRLTGFRPNPRAFSTTSSRSPNNSPLEKEEWPNPMGLPMWSEEELAAVKVTRRPVENLTDRTARFAVNLLRTVFDRLSGYSPGNMTERKWLMRCVFLETVAGVPGFMGGMVRHLSSLRNMRRDKGFINCMLSEAENERMHLLVFVKLLQPSLLFRLGVIMTQGVFANAWFMAYMIYPKICHRFVGFLEEEAVRTYTGLLEDIDKGVVWKDAPAPTIAKTYWQLGPDATMRDVILAVRADEANHRDVNHVIADLPKGASNPFVFSKHVKHGLYVSQQEATEAEELLKQMQEAHDRKTTQQP